MGKRRRLHGRSGGADGANTAPMSKGGNTIRLPFKEWLNDYPTVQAWMDRYDLDELLDANGGICRIENFLPPHIAQGGLALLEAISDKEWNNTEAQETERYGDTNVDHKFWSCKAKPGSTLDNFFRVISLLQPERLFTLSGAKYVKSHHIDVHDDRMYTPVLMNDGTVVQCSRDIAVVYYLTKDWREEYGGSFIDDQTGTTYVPIFNSVVCFRIPRYHTVTAVTGARCRYSMFGWFLEPGELYSLVDKSDEEEEVDEVPKKKKMKKSPQDSTVEPVTQKKLKKKKAVAAGITSAQAALITSAAAAAASAAITAADVGDGTLKSKGSNKKKSSLKAALHFTATKQTSGSAGKKRS